MRQSPHACGTPAFRLCSDVPILPSVVAAAGDALTSGQRARAANRSGGGVRSILPKTHLLRTGDESRQPLREFHFQRVRQRKTVALRQLCRHRGIDFIVCVTENVRQQSLDVIDTFVPIHIPNPAALAFARNTGATP